MRKLRLSNRRRMFDDTTFLCYSLADHAIASEIGTVKFISIITTTTTTSSLFSRRHLRRIHHAHPPARQRTV
jgi:hypothetical protein